MTFRLQIRVVLRSALAALRQRLGRDDSMTRVQLMRTAQQRMTKRRKEDPGVPADAVTTMNRVKKQNPGDDDADAFARAMADVVPLRREAKERIKERPLVKLPVQAPPTGGSGGPDAESGDFAAPGVDRREIRKLRRGDHSPSDHLDLHGMTAQDACASVQRFIDNSRQAQHRCVCIVHGRGLHSAGNVSVLKARVRRLLGSLRAVLAYADAPRSDGGAGAVYVLLRK